MHFILLVSTIECLILLYYTLNSHDKWVPGHRGMAHPQVEDGRKASCMEGSCKYIDKADKADPSSLGVQ